MGWSKPCVAISILAELFCTRAIAAPALHLPKAAIQAERGLTAEPLRYRCRPHLCRYSRREPLPRYDEPVYPAPPVGITLRKIFGLGYL